MLFTARRGGNTDVYLLDRATGDTTRLTRDSAADNYARPAPDGALVAFQSRREGPFEIYLMNPDGSAPRNLTSHEAWDVLPAWAPDGSAIAFMSTRGYTLGDPAPFPGHLYLVRPDGGGLRQLTREPLTSSLGPQDWTPDGRHLLLSREVDGSLDLFLLDVATGAEARFTSDPADEYGASVSHDGTRIAFHAEADGISHIVVIGRDGTGRRTLTAGPGLRYGPRWSPDDTWLLFSQQGPGGERDYDLRAVRIADGRVVPIVVTPDDEREGDWVR